MPITHLQISLDKAQEAQFREQGYNLVPGNLNKGAGGNRVFLWYKDEPGDNITRIQFSYSDEMAKCLSDAGYYKIKKNINAGTGGDEIYLWYFRGITDADVPIKGLHVSLDANNEAQMLQSGYEKLICDLNRWAGGNWIYLWVERDVPMYISDVRATTSWNGVDQLLCDGYTRIDDYINKFVNQDRVYIWYLKTTDQGKAIRDLQLSKSEEEYNNLQKQGYKVVNMDLNGGTGRDQIFLWYKKEQQDGPIKSMGMITQRVLKEYERVGATIREMFSVATCSGHFTFYLYFIR
ncbi:unnamed protein product [Ophioblennius macclurei]